MPYGPKTHTSAVNCAILWAIECYRFLFDGPDGVTAENAAHSTGLRVETATDENDE